MRTKIIVLIGSAIVSWLATNAMGQFVQPVRVSDILGGPVRDTFDQKVGTVKDVAVDLENGRVAEVVVSWGGFLGVNNKWVAVIPQEFTVEPEGRTLHANMDMKSLRNAPAVDIAAWKDSMEQSRVEQVYRYYSATPYFFPHDGAAPVTVRFDHLLRGGQLIGTEVVIGSGQKIGKVGDIVVDLPDGRVVEVIIDSRHYPGTHEELSAVPPEVLHYDSDRAVVKLDATKDQLDQAPHFPYRSWPRIDGDQAAAVYAAYHVTPYFSGQTFSDSGKRSLEQGTSATDVEITAKIQQEILETDGLSLQARAVKVTTLDGRVTLRGMTATLEEKHLLGAIAARVVPAANVDNEIQVKDTAADAAN